MRQQLAGPEGRNLLATGWRVVRSEGISALGKGVTPAVARGVLYGGAWCRLWAAGWGPLAVDLLLWFSLGLCCAVLPPLLLPLARPRVPAAAHAAVHVSVLLRLCHGCHAAHAMLRMWHKGHAVDLPAVERSSALAPPMPTSCRPAHRALCTHEAGAGC